MHPVVKQWLGMTRGELDAIFPVATPCAPVAGNTEGTLIFPITGLSLFMGKVWWLGMRVFDFALVQRCGPGASVRSQQEM